MAHAKQDDWDTYTYMLTRGEKKVLVQVEAILNPFSHTSLVPRLSATESLGTRLLTHTHSLLTRGVAGEGALVLPPLPDS